MCGPSEIEMGWKMGHHMVRPWGFPHANWLQWLCSGTRVMNGTGPIMGVLSGSHLGQAHKQTQVGNSHVGHYGTNRQCHMGPHFSTHLSVIWASHTNVGCDYAVKYSTVLVISLCVLFDYFYLLLHILLTETYISLGFKVPACCYFSHQDLI